MKIKDASGNEHNVGSQSQATLNTVLGALGTANALGNGLNILGTGRGGNRPPQDPDDRPVTRYEMGLIRESLAKDLEIALLKSKQYTDEMVNAAERRQCEVNTQQAVYNGVNTATVNCIKEQVGMLLGMTRLTIPNGNVSPGWGPAIVEPLLDATTKANSASQNTQNNG